MRFLTLYENASRHLILKMLTLEHISTFFYEIVCVRDKENVNMKNTALSFLVFHTVSCTRSKIKYFFN